MWRPFPPKRGKNSGLRTAHRFDDRRATARDVQRRMKPAAAPEECRRTGSRSRAPRAGRGLRASPRAPRGSGRSRSRPAEVRLPRRVSAKRRSHPPIERGRGSPWSPAKPIERGRSTVAAAAPPRQLILLRFLDRNAARPIIGRDRLRERRGDLTVLGNGGGT
jgi:hypothetical protein